MPLTINTTPVELTTKEGYDEFVKSPLCNDCATVFPDNADQGYILDSNNEIVATVNRQVRDSIYNIVPSYGVPLQTI
jgi:hypothetical protein